MEEQTERHFPRWSKHPHPHCKYHPRRRLVLRNAGDNTWLGCPVAGCFYVHAAEKHFEPQYECKRLKEGYLRYVEPW
jgi:hypothetical protein